MITFSNNDKRWLEIIFYLLCRKVYSINNKQEDIIDFINGYRWTNMFDCDILISTLQNKDLLNNKDFIPSNYEFLSSMEDENSRLRIQRRGVRELIRGTEFKYWRRNIYHMQMKKEVQPLELFPKITDVDKFHTAIYSFLLALRYIADIVKIIKF